MLRKNGFELVIGDPNGGAGTEHAEKVYLAAQPISKETVFDFRGEY